MCEVCPALSSLSPPLTSAAPDDAHIARGAGTFMHACEGEAVCKLTNAKSSSDARSAPGSALAIGRARPMGTPPGRQLSVRVFARLGVRLTEERAALLQRPHIPGEQDPGGKGRERSSARSTPRCSRSRWRRASSPPRTRKATRVPHLARQAAAHGALLAAEGRRRPRRRRPRGRGGRGGGEAAAEAAAAAAAAWTNAASREGAGGRAGSVSRGEVEGGGRGVWRPRWSGGRGPR